MALSSSGGAGSTKPNQSAISQRGWDLHAVRGGIDSGDLCFPLRLVRDVDVWQEVLSGDGTLSSPVAVSATNTRQSAIGYWGWGFQHHAERHRPGGSPPSSPYCCSCRCAEGFLICGSGLILPGCGETRRTPANQRSARLGLRPPRCAGRYRPGGYHYFRPWFVGVVEVRNDF